MARPKTKGKRRGGRDRQFFEGLSGLANALNHTIAENQLKTEYDPEAERRLKASKLGAAQAKRERRAERNKKLLNPTHPTTGDSP